MRHSGRVHLCLQAKDLHDSLCGTIIQRQQPEYLVAALNQGKIVQTSTRLSRRVRLYVELM